MTLDFLIRFVALCVALASAETLHGIVRTIWVTPRIGKDLAIKLSAVTGTILASTICWAFVPDLSLESLRAHLALGVALAIFMASFDVAIGRWLMRKSWAKIWPDFDPRTGNYLLIGLLVLCFVPLAIGLINSR
jgi:hypothetical protein